MKRGRCHAKTKAYEEFSIEICLKKNEEFVEKVEKYTVLLKNLDTGLKIILFE